VLQGFVRSTTKYWVRAEDVSVVKYHILQVRQRRETAPAAVLAAAAAAAAVAAAAAALGDKTGT
jgi:hypothetical protein